MPRSIIPLLAERLDISEERAESLLNSMLTELRQRAEADGVQLSELGTFRKEDGTLTFVPSSSLRRLVNHQFEGLSAEDLSAPDDEETPPPLREMPDPEEAHGTTPEPAPSSETPTSEPEAPDSASAEPTPEPEPSETVESPPDDEESIPTIDPIEEDEIAPSTIGEEAEADAEDRETESSPNLGPADPDSPQDDGAEGQSPEIPPEDEDEDSESADADRSLGPLPLIGGLVLIVLLGVGLWYVFSDGESAQTPYGGEEPQTTQTADAPSSQPEESSEGQNDTSDAQTDRFAGVPPDGQDATTEATADSGNWTIVVASLTSRSTAEDVADDFSGRFASVEIVPATVEGTSYYRVTVGRYASEDAAERALSDHAASLPSGAWTHQIQ